MRAGVVQAGRDFKSIRCLPRYQPESSMIARVSAELTT